MATVEQSPEKRKQPGFKRSFPRVAIPAVLSQIGWLVGLSAGQEIGQGQTKEAAIKGLISVLCESGAIYGFIRAGQRMERLENQLNDLKNNQSPS